HAEGKSPHLVARLFERLKGGYGRSLGWALRHPGLLLLLLLVTLGFNVYLYKVVPKGFFPQQDTGRISGSIQAQQYISFTAMQQKLSAYMNIIREDPAVDAVSGSVGGGS